MPRIDPDQNVAELLRREPWALDILLSFGFKPLANPVTRKVMSHLVTLRQACERNDCMLDEVLDALLAAVPEAAGIDLGTGVLELEQLRQLFATLPVDLTFVDHEDRVRFFSEGPDRIFTRSPIIIGRKVQHCHPPKSVDTVERILADFRSGAQSTAEFWITFQGRFVHIRYFAVREQGEYRGCLEVTQDVTRIRDLQGERRLLSYKIGCR